MLVPNNRILRWTEETGTVSVFREPSHNANGHTRDRQGRLVSCEHDSRRVTRTEPDGRITVLLCANLCFGGLKHNRLFMAASQSVYALYVAARGAQVP